jgi:FMN phosphatase YigB (HAD superfamily)
MTAVEKLSLPVEDILFVGDCLDNDIQGAQRVGMKAVWINRDKENSPDGIVPDFEIHHLSDLTNIVASKV